MSVRTATRNFDLLLAIAHPLVASSQHVETAAIPVVHGGNRLELEADVNLTEPGAKLSEQFES